MGVVADVGVVGVVAPVDEVGVVGVVDIVGAVGVETGTATLTSERSSVWSGVAASSANVAAGHRSEPTSSEAPMTRARE